MEKEKREMIGVCRYGKSTLTYAITNALVKEGYENAFKDKEKDSEDVVDNDE